MPDTSDKNGFRLWYALSVAWQLGVFIVGPIVGFLLLGLWADQALGTRPLLLIGGVVTGCAVTVYEVYHLLIPIIEHKDEHDD